MAKKENEKTKAELYREERKARIAKANKKNAKSLEAGKKVAGIGKKVVAVVLCAAILFGICCWANAIFGFTGKMSTALKVGSQRVSATEYEFYYKNMYQQAAYMEQMYQQYGQSSGFSTDKAPDEIPFTGEDGKPTNYAEYFRTESIEQARQLLAYYLEAKANGFELDEDAQNEINETIENYKSTAAENGYSLDSYLRASFGAGFTTKMFRKQLEIQETASHYQEKLKEDFTAAVKLDDIKAEYNKNKKDYDYADIHYYKFAGETLTAEEGETEKDLEKRQNKENEKIYKEAEGVYADVTDVATLETALADYLKAKEEEKKAEDEKDKAEDEKAEETAEEPAETEEQAEDKEEDKEEVKNTIELKNSTYSSISSAVSTKGGDWVYAKDRKAGDKTLIKDGASAYIIIIDKPAYTGNSVSFRHIKIAVQAEDAENVTDAEKKEAKKTADSVYKEWKAGDKTEETFSDLANKESSDSETNTIGGLVKNYRISSGGYNDEFNAWIFSADRKKGDTKVIKADDDGYEIVYFVSNNKDDIDQYDSIRTKMASDKVTENEKALLADDGKYVADVNEKCTIRVMKNFCKTIRSNIAYQNRQK
jgi:hypothetical protein